MKNVPSCVSFREEGQNLKMENFHCGSSGESQIPHIVPKRVAALRAEVEHNRVNIQTQARRRFRDYKPSPLSLPPLRKRSSNMRISVHHRQPEFITSYPVLPPISRRKSQTEKSGYSNGNVTSNNNRFSTRYNKINSPPHGVPYITHKNSMLYKTLNLPSNVDSEASYYTKNVSTFNKGYFTNYNSGHTAQSSNLSNIESALHIKPRIDLQNTDCNVKLPLKNATSSRKINFEQQCYGNVEPPLIGKVRGNNNGATPSNRSYALLSKYANVQPFGNNNLVQPSDNNDETSTKVHVEQKLDRCHSENGTLESSNKHLAEHSLSNGVKQPINDNAAHCRPTSRKEELSNNGIAGEYMYGNIPPSELDQAVKYIYREDVHSQPDSPLQHSCKNIEQLKTDEVAHCDTVDIELCKRFESKECIAEKNDSYNVVQYNDGNSKPCNLDSEEVQRSQPHSTDNSQECSRPEEP